jgi:hypothetical protein
VRNDQNHLPPHLEFNLPPNDCDDYWVSACNDDAEVVMTRDDIIRMAREAWGDTDPSVDSVAWYQNFEKFAALVAAAERNRVLGIAKGMQEKLQAKFEQNYMQGVIAGAEAEREACAQIVETARVASNWNEREALAATIRERGQE